MKKLEDWAVRLRNKDWNPVFDKLHQVTVRIFMGATVVSGAFVLYTMYKWKQEIDFRQEVENFRVEEEERRRNVEEGTREELKDPTPELKDSARQYKFS